MRRPRFNQHPQTILQYFMRAIHFSYFQHRRRCFCNLKLAIDLEIDCHNMYFCMCTLCFCRAWPNIDIIDQKWKRLQNPLLELLCSGNVIYTKASGGKWLKVKEAVFNRLDGDQPNKLLVNVLLEAHENVATLPNHVLKAFSLYTTNTKEITPALVRQVLKETPASYRNLERMEKLDLLQFVLRDGNFADLLRLELLPIASGVFTCFSNSAETIYICSPEHPRKLLPCLDHRLLDQDVSDNLLRSLEKVAKKGMNV